MESCKFIRLSKDYSLRIHKLSEYLSNFDEWPIINTVAVERIRALELDRALFELLIACDLEKGCVIS